MQTLAIELPTKHIDSFCRKNHIRRLSLFGSILTPDFSPSSDIDILVVFKDGFTPGFGFFKLQEDLSRLLGRQVDLHTVDFLSPYFRDEVINSALVLFNE